MSTNGHKLQVDTQKYENAADTKIEKDKKEKTLIEVTGCKSGILNCI